LVTVPNFITFTLAMVVYFVGYRLNRSVAFLRDFNIPEPVVGGLLVAVGAWLVFLLVDLQLSFELDVRDQLLVIFFVTIGLNAKLATLIQGGRPLALLLGLTVGFMLLQNVVGLIGAVSFGLPAGASVLLGSASLIGGHGTAIAWGPEVASRYAMEGAAEMGIAAATFGLIIAALIGGPIARLLVERDGLTPRDEDADPIVGLSYEDVPQASLDFIGLMRALVTINLAIILGFGAHQGLQEAGIRLPLFVPCLLVGIVFANAQPLIFPRLPVVSGTPVLALISEFSLAVFLSISLMSMQLWSLVELAGPLFVVLALQALLAIAFCVYALYPVMGRSYRAAVLGAGFGGFALGATPTAIANMTAVTKRYGPAPMAFIILPLVSAFFVDLANAFIIQLFLSL
ncbi:MAG: sodium/glutamate symporter, partial [Pseudomonadota bacterium]